MIDLAYIESQLSDKIICQKLKRDLPLELDVNENCAGFQLPNPLVLKTFDFSQEIQELVIKTLQTNRIAFLKRQLQKYSVWRSQRDVQVKTTDFAGFPGLYWDSRETFSNR